MRTPYPSTTYSRGTMTWLRKAREDTKPEVLFLTLYILYPGSCLEHPDCLYVELLVCRRVQEE